MRTIVITEPAASRYELNQALSEVLIETGLIRFENERYIRAQDYSLTCLPSNELLLRNYENDREREIVTSLESRGFSVDVLIDVNPLSFPDQSE